MADWLSEYYPRIREELPGTRERRVEIWAQEKLGFRRFQSLPETMAGFVNEKNGLIYVRNDHDCMQQTICHELIHALLDESWRTLPAVIEEGLCEELSMQVVDGCGMNERARLLLSAATYLKRGPMSAVLKFEYEDPRRGMVELERPVNFPYEYPDSISPTEAIAEAGNSLSAYSGGTRLNPYHYGFGTWIVERIVARVGYSGLRKLCTRASAKNLKAVPKDWILDAAHVGASSTWLQKVHDAMGETDLTQMLLEGDRVVTQMARWMRIRFDSESPAELLLSRTRITFGFVGQERRVSLLDSPRFRKRLLAHL